MDFRPLHDRVVVRRVTAEERSSGGIIIPDTAQEKPMQGDVVAVGPGARDETGRVVTPDVKAGDRILFGKWSGTEVKLGGDELLICRSPTSWAFSRAGRPPLRQRPKKDRPGAGDLICR
jgi:chaperonin GroES